MLTPNSDFFDTQVKDVAQLILEQTDPSARYNREQLIEVTSVFNRALRYTDLSNYPTIKNRLRNSLTESRDFSGQFNTIPYIEVADFITQVSFNINDFEYNLVEFDNVQTYQVNYPNLFISNFTEPYRNILDQYEGYLSNNANANASSGFCSTISNAFGQVMGIVSQIQAGVSLINGLLNDFRSLAEGGLSGLIENLINNFIGGILNQLNALRQQLLQTVENLVNTFMSQIEGLVSSISQLTQDIREFGYSVMNRLHSAINGVREFFSEFSIQRLRERIEEFVNDAAAQFEELTPENIALLLFRFCQFAEFLQSFFSSPLDAVRGYIGNLLNQRNLLLNAGLRETLRAAAFGGFRLDDEEIDRARDRLRDGVNEGADDGPPGEPFNYIPSASLTASERQFVIDPVAEGLPGRIVWDPGGVINMGRTVSDAADDDGFRRVSPEILEKAVLVSKRINKVLYINSAYRSPLYNARLDGAARGSLHMSGRALDVGMGGFSDEDIIRFISAASSEGVGGMKFYSGSNFVHIDTGARRTWDSSGRMQRYINMHLAGEYTSGPRGRPQEPVNPDFNEDGTIDGEGQSARPGARPAPVPGTPTTPPAPAPDPAPVPDPAEDLE
jgi:hypothetical protein